MTIDKTQAIKEKLQKLIAKEASARDIGNQAEADAFASKIQELMLEYEIEIDEVMGQARVWTTTNQKFDCQTMTRPHESDWIKYLYAGCAKSAFCKILTFSKGNAIMIYGEPNNIELLHFMCAQLSIKVRELARKSFSAYQGEDKRNTYMRSFYKGAVHGITVRLKKDKDAQAQQYGIVLSSERKLDDYIKEWAAQTRTRIGTSKSSMNSGSSRDAYASGYSAGLDVGVNKGVNGSHTEPKRLG